jgi:signal recognition particle-docking protein FtsY
LEIDIDLIEPSPYQPRTRFREEALDELARSIQASGIIQPIVVRPIGSRFQLIAGERRWRAAQRAGLKKVSAIAKHVADELALEMTLVENIQREDLNPIEAARAFERLMDEFQLTQESVAERTGKDRATVANAVRLLPTSIGKLANRLRKEGLSVILCAADTFRAAAVEQLEIWAQRNGIEVIKQKSGADPAAVVYDAVVAAKARSSDAVIVDTAGRLHTKSNLMAELEKMKRTAAKVIPGAPHDVLLVLDATTGQNGLAQAREFTSTVGVTGIILTKLDGTAKGGIVVAISRELALPIRFVGTGEQINDLVPFDAETYASSLFD